MLEIEDLPHLTNDELRIEYSVRNIKGSPSEQYQTLCNCLENEKKGLGLPTHPHVNASKAPRRELSLCSKFLSDVVKRFLDPNDSLPTEGASGIDEKQIVIARAQLRHVYDRLKRLTGSPTVREKALNLLESCKQSITWLESNHESRTVLAETVSNISNTIDVEILSESDTENGEQEPIENSTKSNSMSNFPQRSVGPIPASSTTHIPNTFDHRSNSLPLSLPTNNLRSRSNNLSIPNVGKDNDIIIENYLNSDVYNPLANVNQLSDSFAQRQHRVRNDTISQPTSQVNDKWVRFTSNQFTSSNLDVDPAYPSKVANQYNYREIENQAFSPYTMERQNLNTSAMEQFHSRLSNNHSRPLNYPTNSSYTLNQSNPTISNLYKNMSEPPPRQINIDGNIYTLNNNPRPCRNETIPGQLIPDQHYAMHLRNVPILCTYVMYHDNTP